MPKDKFAGSATSPEHPATSVTAITPSDTAATRPAPRPSTTAYPQRVRPGSMPSTRQVAIDDRTEEPLANTTSNTSAFGRVSG